MTSGRGLPVLVYAGHMYTLEERKNNKTLWVCVKKRKLNCQGCVTTTSQTTNLSGYPEALSPGSAASSTASTSSVKGKGKRDKDDKESVPKILSYCGHNHSHLNDIIERIQPKDCVSITPKT